MIAQTGMDAAEAERRYTSVLLTGGTQDERVFALKRWKDAMRREWFEQREQETRAAKHAAAKALSGS